MNDDWKKKGRKEFDFFDFGAFQEIIDEMMKDFFDEEQIPIKRKPLVMGFNIKLGPNGKPIIEQFGNVKAMRGKPVISDAREPLVDVIESEKDITITAELPGVDKKDLMFRLPSNDKAIIEVRGERNFYKEIDLPAKVKRESAKAKFKNGILEVRLEKEKPGKTKQSEDQVKIE